MTANREAVLRFNQEMMRWTDEQVPQMVALVHRKLTLDALARIVMRTPVDTGRARGNWQTTVAAPATGMLDAVDPSGSAANARGASAVANLQPFTTTHITNNLPYIERLEEGWSKRSPNGMVAITFGELVSQFQRIDEVKP